MAEEVLVKEVLTPEMMSAGRTVVQELERRSFGLNSAFWFFDSEQGRWRLYLASPLIESRGPRFAYQAVSNLLNEQPTIHLALEDIAFVSPQNSIVGVLSSAVGTGGKIVGFRFSRNSINGRYIEDAYIYKT